MLTPGELDDMREMQRELMFDSVEVDRKIGTTWSEEQQETVDMYEPVYRAADGGPGPARVWARSTCLTFSRAPPLCRAR